MLESGQFLLLKGGILSSVQDAGRQGTSHLGLARSGAMDRHAWAWNNRLLENPWGAATLEIYIGGLEGVFSQETSVVITGAELPIWLNDQPQASWTVFRCRAGDRLRLGYAHAGQIAYLGVKGGWQLPREIGESRSSVLREGLGGPGNQGQPLAAGEQLSYRIDASPLWHRTLATKFRPQYHTPVLDLAFLPAQYLSDWEVQQLKHLFATGWRVSSASNRMACLLEPASPETNRSNAEPAPTRLSEGLALGSLQLPPSGQPMILMNEHQTIGGYPMLGWVCRRSLDRLAQCRPGQALALVLADRAEQLKAEIEFQAFFRQG